MMISWNYKLLISDKDEDINKFSPLWFNQLPKNTNIGQIFWLRYKEKDIDKLNDIVNKTIIKENKLTYWSRNIQYFFRRPLFNSLFLYNDFRINLKIVIIWLTFLIAIGWARSYYKNEIAGIIVLIIALLFYFLSRMAVNYRLHLINERIEPIYDQFNYFQNLLFSIIANSIWYVILILVA